MISGIVSYWFKAGLISIILTFVIPSDLNKVVVQAASNSNSSYATSASEVQRKIEEGLIARKSSITIKYKGKTSKLDGILNQSINKALDTDHYTKYIVDRYTYSWRGTSGTAKINLEVEYRETVEQSNYVDDQVELILRSIVKPTMNDHQRVKVIHDYVVKNLKYDEKLQKYTAYEGLKTGEVVCQGYTLLTYKLLKSAGIDNYIVEGTAGDQTHAWNLVSLDGKWYHLDTTWDDPLTNKPQEVRYEYYLRSDKQIKVDHKWVKSYPAANTLYRDTLSVLAQKGGDKAGIYTALEAQLGYDLYYAGVAISNSTGLKDKARQSINDGNSTITIRYSGSEQQLMSDLGDLYDLAILDIRYVIRSLEDTKDLKVEIYWTHSK